MYKEEVYYDDPLASSTARPCSEEELQRLANPVIVEKKSGQRLEGDMIPVRR